MRKIHRAKIEKGRIEYSEPWAITKALSVLEGQKVDITISKHKKARPQRSSEQNKYYWGAVINLLEDFGNEPQDIHNALKMKFLAEPKNGLWFAPSTTDLDIAKMEEYLRQVREWASMEMGIYIPLPNEIDCTDVK